MHISIGLNKTDLKNFKSIEVGTVTKLSSVITAVNYSLGTFKDGVRRKEAFISADAIGLDFDANYTLAKAIEDFKDYKHIIAPTRSHGVEKNGVTCDRFRVILFLESPITDSATFESTWYSLYEKFPAADSQCKDASRFFYPSTHIASISGKGKLVPVVAPRVREPAPAPTVLAPTPGAQRGTLGKPTLDFLEKGVESGGRNHATAKAAKDFQQNLYTLDEAIERITSALHSNGTIARDFTEEEVVRTIRSAYNSEPRHEARIKPRAFNLIPISELYKTNSKVEWLVDGLLTVGGVSLMSSDPKAGKSTLIRQLMREVLRGHQFLGRQCKKGTAHYYGIEEQIEVVNASFRRLGIMNNEPLLVHVGDPLTDNKMEDFHALLMETRPAIAVIDTLFDFLEVESENNYKEVKRELRKMRQIARESGTHIVLVHHNSKGQKDDKRRGNRGILGSQAIAGGVDTIMVLEVEGSSRLITTSGREIKRWVNRELVWEPKDCTYSLGAEVDEF